MDIVSQMADTPERYCLYDRYNQRIKLMVGTASGLLSGWRPWRRGWLNA